jgi:hypothetical protein
VVDELGQFDPGAWLFGPKEDSAGMPVMISVRPCLRWIEYPTFDHHLTLTKRYRAREDGFPADSETLNALYDLADEVERTLEGRGILAGYVTHHGHRAFHVYLDGEDQNSRQAIAEWATVRKMKVRSEPDPAWRQIRQLTG